MTVLELKTMLNKYPDDMCVITSRYSDYAIINEEDWIIVKGVETSEWIMLSHPTMSRKNIDKEKEYLHLLGN